MIKFNHLSSFLLASHLHLGKLLTLFQVAFLSYFVNGKKKHFFILKKIKIILIKVNYPFAKTDFNCFIDVLQGESMGRLRTAVFFLFPGNYRIHQFWQAFRVRGAARAKGNS